MALALSSKAFSNEGTIPSKYTCEGENIAPPLEWNGAPENTRSLVLIIDDPDAPDPEVSIQHVGEHPDTGIVPVAVAVALNVPCLSLMIEGNLSANQAAPPGWATQARHIQRPAAG